MEKNSACTGVGMGLPLKCSPERKLQKKRRKLELWWAGLRECGKQPRLTGIVQARRGHLRQTERVLCSLNITELWLTTQRAQTDSFFNAQSKESDSYY